MKTRLFIITAILGAALVLPVSAQVRPGDAEDVTAIDVVAEHEQISATYELFGSEFADFLGGDTDLAFFAPIDDVIAELDTDDVSAADLEALFESHVATGIASREPIEFIEWFVTVNGERVTVTVEDGTVWLNDTAVVIDAIATENGIVYIIDAPLGS